MGRVVGIVAALGSGAAEGALGRLLGDAELALAPFGARFRVLDFALASLANSGVREGCVVVASANGGAADLQGRLPSGRRWRGILGAPLPRSGAGPLVRGLLACREALPALARTGSAVVLPGGHLVHADLRPLLAVHDATQADVTLACLPGPGLGAASVVCQTDGPYVRSLAADPDQVTLPLGWTGGFAVRLDALATLGPAPGHQAADAALLAALTARGRLAACDLHAGPSALRATWQVLTSVESYYEAHMALCGPRPRVDAWDPEWPVRPEPAALPAARVIAEPGGCAGQAVSTVLADGCLVRGGTVLRSILGPGALVDAGAEVEDSILFAGARVGRGACVRRALLGPRAAIADGHRVGFDDEPGPGSELLPSGLTIIPGAGALPFVASAPR